MLDLAIVLAFIAYAVTAGLRNRGEASKGLVEFFLAGKSLKGWQAGTSMAGVGRLLIPPPGASAWASWGLVAAGLAVVPVWGKGLRPGVRAADRAAA